MSVAVEQSPLATLTPQRTPGYDRDMDAERRITTPAEMDQMTPQQRADAVRESVVHSLDELDPAFRARVEARARKLAAALPGRE